MKAVPYALVLALTLASPLLVAAPTSAQTGRIYIVEDAKGDGGYWKTTFTDPPKQLTQQHAALRDRLMKRRVLEEYVEFLSPVRWPHALRLFASDCNGGSGDSPYYAKNLYYINMCYGFAELGEQAADVLLQLQNKKKLPIPVSRDSVIAGLYAATLLHETGHAAFDIMDVPVFGREEDAADQVAAFIAMQFGKETARTVIKGFAYLWYLLPNPPVAKPNPRDPKYPKDPKEQCFLDPFCAFADEHGTSAQRMYNALCMAYGGHPDWVQDFVDSRWLPPDRAKVCADEYQTVKAAFAKTVLPFIDQEQMKKVQTKSWFTGQELRER
jgi:hypothetical protein